jgi:glycosyltransferase involved in cell wall biosynthesis
VEPNDPQNLAKAIISLSKDENSRKNISEKGIERSQSFSWRKTAEETLKIYLEVYGRPPSK